MWVVYGFEYVFFFVYLNWVELRFGVVWVVFGGVVQVEVFDVGCYYVLVIVLELLFFYEVGQFFVQYCVVGQLQWQVFVYQWVDGEQFKFFVQFVVVVLFGFFELKQVFVQFFLGGECYVVDVLEDGVFFVVVLVCVVGVYQFEVLWQFVSVREVWFLVQVGVVVLVVEGDGFVVW